MQNLATVYDGVVSVMELSFLSQARTVFKRGNPARAPRPVVRRVLSVTDFRLQISAQPVFFSGFSRKCPGRRKGGAHQICAVHHARIAPHSGAGSRGESKLHPFGTLPI